MAGNAGCFKCFATLWVSLPSSRARVPPMLQLPRARRSAVTTTIR